MLQHGETQFGTPYEGANGDAMPAHAVDGVHLVRTAASREKWNFDTTKNHLEEEAEEIKQKRKK